MINDKNLILAKIKQTSHAIDFKTKSLIKIQGVIELKSGDLIAIPNTDKFNGRLIFMQRNKLYLYRGLKGFEFNKDGRGQIKISEYNDTHNNKIANVYYI